MKAKFAIAMLMLIVCAVSLGDVTGISGYDWIKHDCNGSTTGFTYNFRILQASDLVVIHYDSATDTSTTLTNVTDYTVSVSNEDYRNMTGGTVTTVATYGATIDLIISTQFTMTQLAQMTYRWQPATVEDALDKSRLIDRQFQRNMLRCLRGPEEDDPNIVMQFGNAAERAEKWAGFGADGGVVLSDSVTPANAIVSVWGETLIDDPNAVVGRGTLELDTDDDVEFGTIKVTGPWFDVKYKDFGARGDGETNDTAALQAAIDAASAVKGTVVLPIGIYSFDDTLKFYNSVTFEGLGRQAGKWNYNEGGVILRWDGDNATDAIIIGGTSDSDNTEGGYNNVESVTLKNFLLVPGSELDVGAGHDEGGKDGIVIDGSNTLDANRGFARDIVLEDVDVRRFLGVGLHLIGTTMNIRTFRCGFLHNDTMGFYNERDATPNIGVGIGGQLYLYDTILWSNGAGKPCADMTYTTMFGGHIQGEEGVICRTGCNIFGTHIEGNNTRPSDDTIGIHHMGRGNQYFPKTAITKYHYGIKIGDGTSTSADQYYGNIPLIQSCTVGLQITDGAARAGFLNISGWGAAALTNTDNFVDDRIDTDGVNECAIDFLRIGTNGILIDNTVIASKLITFGAADATPTVAEGNLFVTGGTTTITDLDDTIPGQIVPILCLHSLTFDFTTAQDADHNLDGSSADITVDTGDILQFLSIDGTKLHLMFNLDASADNN